MLKIKYRNGFPTKKSWNEIIEEYDSKMWRLHTSVLYTKNYGGKKSLYWQCKYVQEKIHGFIGHVSETYGIEFGEFQDYESPCVGHVDIKKREKKK